MILRKLFQWHWKSKLANKKCVTSTNLVVCQDWRDQLTTFGPKLTQASSWKPLASTTRLLCRRRRCRSSSASLWRRRRWTSPPTCDSSRPSDAIFRRALWRARNRRRGGSCELSIRGLNPWLDVCSFLEPAQGQRGQRWSQATPKEKWKMFKNGAKVKTIKQGQNITSYDDVHLESRSD